MKPFYFEKSLGIDIRESSAALCLVGKKFRGIDVITTGAFECSPLGPGADEKTRQEFIEGVRQFLDNMQGSPDQTTVCLPRRYVSIKTFSLPAPDRESVDAMVEFEIDRHFSASPENLHVSYRVEDAGENLFKVIAGAVHTSVFEFFWELFEQAGIRPSLVDISTFSNLNLIQQGKKIVPGNEALVDVSRDSVEITVLNDGVVELSRSIPVADPDFREHFHRHDLEGNRLRPHATRFAGFVSEALQSTLYSCNFIREDESIDIIHLASGGAYHEALAFELEEQTGVSIRPLTPPDAVAKTLPLEFDAATHNTALGLALRGAQFCRYQLNLLPQERIPVRRRASLRTTVALLLVTAFLAGGFLISKVSYNNMTLNSLNAQLKEVKTQVGSLEKVDREYDELVWFAETLNQIDRDFPLKVVVLKELSRVLPKNTYVTRISISRNSMEVQGFSQAASPLIQQVEDSPLFINAAFRGSVVNQKNGQKFTIQAEITPEAP
ncbi:MAG: PilN domain-containing protein [Nitrospina sp.]|nr:PilN domain-containing protein [Nitrospina sp.]